MNTDPPDQLEPTPAEAARRARAAHMRSLNDDRQRLRLCTLTPLGKERLDLVLRKARDLSVQERGLHRLDRETDLLRVLAALGETPDAIEVQATRIVLIVHEVG